MTPSLVHDQFAFWPLYGALALLIGFAADRAGICTVKAVEEVLTTRRAYFLLSFGKTALWVVGITALITLIFDLDNELSSSYRITLGAFLGGLVFGIGAVLNGGCAFSTLTRLGKGNLGMLVTLSGFALGLLLYLAVEPEWTVPVRSEVRPTPRPMEWTSVAIAIVVGAWMLWEVVRLLRSVSEPRWRQRIAAHRYRLSTTAALMGTANGVLYAMLGTWAYTHTFRLALSGPGAASVDASSTVSMSLLWFLFAALVAGVFISAVVGRNFCLSWKPKPQWLGYALGGLLMGIGAAMIPGGNDVLILHSIPGLSPHGLPAFAAVLLGIALALEVFKYFGAGIPVVDCSGDLCRETSNEL